MRRFSATIAIAACCAVTAAIAPAPAATSQHLSAAPNPVRFGQQLTIRGRGWPVNEFCKTNIRLSLQSDQNAFLIGYATIRHDGSFVRHWVPRRSQVGAGAWRLVARLRCESGKDGSNVFVRRTLALRIR